jgi:aminoglycoside phosphotransferase (APT) family kinase protein
MTTDSTNEKDALKNTLKHWLSEKIPSARNLQVDEIKVAGAGGFSAETLFLEVSWADDNGQRSAHSMVLRKQITGHDLFHQAELSFQAQVMERLSQAKLPAPTPELVGLEMNTELLGTAFLVMKRLRGNIAPQNPNYNVSGWLTELPLEKRTQAWYNGIRAMAAVHKLDWQDGYQFMARDKAPGIEGYISWLEDWLNWAVAGRDYPIGDATLKYLKENIPEDASIGVVWGDGQPSNILFDEKTGDVTGLLDWELATIGPGEIDLSWWLIFDELFSTWLHTPRLEGLPNREQVIACYEQEVGRPIKHLQYYDVISALRMAIITMRSVDRQVAKGNYKKDNLAWSHNAFTTQLAKLQGLPPIETSKDYIDFTTNLLAKD